MKIEVLVSTMNRSDFNFLHKMNIKSDCLVINQTTDSVDEIAKKRDFVIRVVNCQEKGLSRSRNRALQYAEGDICIFADDDVVYNENYADIVKRAYETFPDYDIIAFKVVSENKFRSKKYITKARRIGYIGSLRVSSCELTFKRSSVLSKNIKFNEDFGAGSGKASMGEENIFLYECLRKGLKILYLPIEIGRVMQEGSSWFNGFDSKYFFDRGACYAAMSTIFSYLLAFQFAVRKWPLYKKRITFANAVNEMNKGIRAFRKKEGCFRA